MGSGAVLLALSSFVATILLTQAAPVEVSLEGSSSTVNPNRDRHGVEEMERFYKTYDNGTVEFKLVLSNGHVQYQRISSKIVDGDKIQVYEGYTSERYMDGRYGTRYYAADENGYRSSPVQVENTPPVLPTSGPYAVNRPEPDQSQESALNEESIPTLIEANASEEEKLPEVLPESEEKVEESDEVKDSEEKLKNTSTNLVNGDLPNPQNEDISAGDRLLSIEPSTSTPVVEETSNSRTEPSAAEEINTGRASIEEISNLANASEEEKLPEVLPESEEKVEQNDEVKDSEEKLKNINTNLVNGDLPNPQDEEISAGDRLLSIEPSTSTPVIEENSNFGVSSTEPPAAEEISTGKPSVEEIINLGEPNAQQPAIEENSVYDQTNTGSADKESVIAGLTDTSSNPLTLTKIPSAEGEAPVEDSVVPIVQNTETVGNVLSVTEPAVSKSDVETSKVTILESIPEESEDKSTQNESAVSSTEAVLIQEENPTQKSEATFEGRSFDGFLETITEAQEVNTNDDSLNVSQQSQISVTSEPATTVGAQSGKDEEVEPVFEVESTTTLVSESEPATELPKLSETEEEQTSVTARVTEISNESDSTGATSTGVLIETAPDQDVPSDTFIDSITTVPNAVNNKDAKSLEISTVATLFEESSEAIEENDFSTTEKIEDKISETTEEVILSSSTEQIPSNNSTNNGDVNIEGVSTLQNFGNKIVETFNDLFSFMSTDKKSDETDSENKTEISQSTEAISEEASSSTSTETINDLGSSSTSTETIKDLGSSSTESTTSEANLKSEKEAKNLDISTELPLVSVNKDSTEDFSNENKISETSTELPSLDSSEDNSSETKDEDTKTETVVSETSTDLIQSVSSEETSTEIDVKNAQDVNNMTEQPEAEVSSTTLENSEENDKINAIEIGFSTPVIHF